MWLCCPSDPLDGELNGEVGCRVDSHWVPSKRRGGVINHNLADHLARFARRRGILSRKDIRDRLPWVNTDALGLQIVRGKDLLDIQTRKTVDGLHDSLKFNAEFIDERMLELCGIDEQQVMTEQDAADPVPPSPAPGDEAVPGPTRELPLTSPVVDYSSSSSSVEPVWNYLYSGCTSGTNRIRGFFPLQYPIESGHFFRPGVSGVLYHRFH